MTDTINIETRMQRLEERLTWLNSHIVEQDKIINLQHREIQMLKEKLAALASTATLRSESTDSPQNDERPPHY